MGGLRSISSLQGSSTIQLGLSSICNARGRASIPRCTWAISTNGMTFGSSIRVSTFLDNLQLRTMTLPSSLICTSRPRTMPWTKAFNEVFNSETSVGWFCRFPCPLGSTACSAKTSVCTEKVLREDLAESWSWSDWRDSCATRPTRSRNFGAAEVATGTTGTTGCGGVVALGVKADEEDSLKLLSRLGGGSTSGLWFNLHSIYKCYIA